jgi:hypothetical protein
MHRGDTQGPSVNRMTELCTGLARSNLIAHLQKKLLAEPLGWAIMADQARFGVLNSMATTDTNGKW